jgi:2-oxoisovalerate dehydrogenase E1 component
MTKDLYDAKDGRWLFPYPPPGWHVPLGEPRFYAAADASPSNETACDLLIITYGNGVHMSLRATRELGARRRVRVMDLRWLKPLNREAVARAAGDAGAVLVVDEGRRTGGLGEEIFTLLDEAGLATRPKRRVTGEDSYIPLAAAANLVLPSEADIAAAAEQLLAETRS